jgi:hypothetical protein
MSKRIVILGAGLGGHVPRYGRPGARVTGMDARRSAGMGTGSDA